MIALLDSDILAYRIGFACEAESVGLALSRLDKIITDILLDCDHGDFFYDEWKLFLTGSNNFRKEIATTAVYKGNRTAPKPQHLPALRKHMIEQWGAVVAEGEEADDAIAIEGTRYGDSCIMVSLDKDFDQIPGWHYNFVKKKHYHVDQAQGDRFFYTQILTGDKADNIIGLFRVGPVKAAKLLEETTTVKEMYDACVKAYDGNADRVIENARLLWLRRYDNELWEPPAN